MVFLWPFRTGLKVPRNCGFSKKKKKDAAQIVVFTAQMSTTLCGYRDPNSAVMTCHLSKTNMFVS